MGRKYDFFIKYHGEKQYKYLASTCTTKNINKDTDFPLPKFEQPSNNYWRWLKSNKDGHYYYSGMWKLCVKFDHYVRNSKCHDVN